MKTTDWRSSRKENRPPSEVTNSHSLAISLPLCLFCGHNGRSLPSHHIYNNKPLKMQSGESAWKCLHVRNKQTILWNLIETTHAMWNVVLCYVLWCRTALWLPLFSASELLHSSCFSVLRIQHPHPSADLVLIGVAVALPFFWQRNTSESCMGEVLPTLQRAQTKAFQSRTFWFSVIEAKEERERMQNQKGKSKPSHNFDLDPSSPWFEVVN